jgi:hypothetical protein
MPLNMQKYRRKMRMQNTGEIGISAKKTAGNIDRRI